MTRALVLLSFVLGACGAATFATDGEACSPAQACSEGLTCRAGRCAVLLADAGLVLDAGAFAAEGQACSPVQACAEGLTCRAGACASFQADGGAFATEGQACSPTRACAEGLTCRAGTCASFQADGGVFATEGQACSPGQACAEGLTCRAGTCAVVQAGSDAGAGWLGDGGLLPDGGPCACLAPPAPRCVGSTLEATEPVGVCTAQGCRYRTLSRTCPGGCASGACLGTGWRRIDPDGGLDVFPTDVAGTDVDDVWVVGWSGRVFHWDGARWAQPFTGVTAEVEVVVASSRDDVSVVTTTGDLFHFDGARWEAVAPLGLSGAVMCAQALGREDFLLAVAGYSLQPFSLYRVTAGTTRLVATAAATSVTYTPQSCELLARSPEDVYVGDSIRGIWHYDGQAFASVPNGAPTLGLTFVEGGALYSASIGELSAWSGSAWQHWNAPTGKIVAGIAGTRTNALFCGLTPLINASDPSAVVRWDGAQFTVEPGTTVAGRMKKLWRGRGGEVFAVTSDGEVLLGP